MSTVRPIAICLFTNGNRFLANRDFDAVKNDYYWRPLGGGIEFGERSEVGIRREIEEEIGKPITNLRLVDIIENLFTLEGTERHEIVFVYDAEFTDPGMYDASLACYEHGNSTHFTAEWVTVHEIENAGDLLVPEGLKELLSQL